MPSDGARVTDDRETWFIREVLPHEAALYGYLSRFFAQPTDVEDAVQDSYARLIMLSTEERARIQSVHAFLFTAARNVALDRLRRERVVSLETMAELDDLNIVDQQPAAWEEMNARQELALLRRALATLPERCRQVMTLRKVFGLSQKEIAQRLGVTENTVEKQVANGMRLCATRFHTLMQGGTVARGPVSPACQSRGRKDVE